MAKYCVVPALDRFQTAEDPMLAMLEWMTNQLMKLEVTQRCNAPKGVYTETLYLTSKEIPCNTFTNS